MRAVSKECVKHLLLGFFGHGQENVPTLFYSFAHLLPDKEKPAQGIALITNADFLSSVLKTSLCLFPKKLFQCSVWKCINQKSPRQ